MNFVKHPPFWLVMLVFLPTAYFIAGMIVWGMELIPETPIYWLKYTTQNMPGWGWALGAAVCLPIAWVAAKRWARTA